MTNPLLDRAWRIEVGRDKWLATAWTFVRGPTGEPLTNVPRKVIHHSPDGFEWGYHGSGPADLALNMVHAYFKLTNVDDVKCFKGKVASVTWEAHQFIKREIIAMIPREGTLIKRGAVLNSLVDWLRGQRLLF